MTNLTQAIDNTIAWLETDPADRTVGRLAQTDDGHCVSVTDPAACRFCALGYLARQLGIDTDETQVVFERLGELSVVCEIWSANDKGDLPATIQHLLQLKEHVHD